MKCVVLFILAMVVRLTTFSQDNISGKLDELMTAYANVHQFNGSVLIARDGKILLKKGYGYGNYNKKIKTTADSRYQIYSVTKPITATIILKLVEEKKLSLEDKLSEFYPDFPHGNSITIENLLTHTSGIYNYNNDSTMPVDSEKAILEFLKKKPLDFEPGTDWKYSNTGYFLLGFIIQKVTGITFEEAVKKYIFLPLKMSQSGFNYKDLSNEHKTTGYTILLDDTANIAAVYDKNELFSAGGIYSTIKDLYRFHEAMQTNLIIGKALTEKSYLPFKNGYGYGWFIDSLDGRRIVHHGGGASGYRANLIRIPEDNICIILLSNTETADVTAIKKKILSALFNLPYKVPSQIKVPENELLLMQGTYAIAPSINIYVTVRNGRITARPSMQPSSVLLPEKTNLFYVDQIDGYIEFKKNPGGIYDTLLLTQNGVSYKGIKINPKWGIVGSSTSNGWDGPDLELQEDSTRRGIWYLKNVQLTAGEIKFRFNNDWTYNYGINPGDNKLNAAGQNIKIEGGRYNIILDMSIAEEPRYIITKIN